MLTRARLREKVKPFARRIRGVAQVSRISVLYVLAHEPMIAKEIADHLALPKNLAAHHLLQLYRTGWVTKIKQGREVRYAVKENAFFDFFRLFEDTPFEKEVLRKHIK